MNNGEATKCRKPLILFFLTAVTVALFWPVIKCDFVNYDDDIYITDNKHITAITWQNIKWAFTSGYASNWHPLTWLSHMLDFHLYGLDPAGHHVTNIILHTANTLLLFILLNLAAKKLWLSFFVAALFGWHPLHVESVAWVSERKDVLSTFFGLLAMIFYVKYVKNSEFSSQNSEWEKDKSLEICRKPSSAGYWLLTTVFYLLSLLSKPMLVTMPFVLLLLDYWPLDRFRTKHISRLIYEKIPLFALSLGSSIVTFIVQKRGGAVSSIKVIDLSSRLGNAIISYTNYVIKMLWPCRLAGFYPHLGERLSNFEVVIAAAVFITAVVLVWRQVPKRKYLLTGFLWYIGTLVPVIGIVQVGLQSMADRYTYVPLIGLFIIIVFGIDEFISCRKAVKAVSIAFVIVVLSSAIVCTHLGLKYWQNDTMLFERILDVSRADYFIHSNFPYSIRYMFSSADRINGMIKNCGRPVELNPNEAAIHSNYASILNGEHRPAEAVEHFKISLQLNPKIAEVYSNFGNALADAGRVDEAIENYNKALQLKPDFAEGHYNLANALRKKERLTEAVEHYRRALTLRPDNSDACQNLGVALAGLNRLDDAVECYRKAIELRPDSIIAHGNLGLTLARLGMTEDALQECRIVLNTSPDDVEMRCNAGVLLERLGRKDEAISEYRLALKARPDYAKAKELLDAALARQKDGRK